MTGANHAFLKLSLCTCFVVLVKAVVPPAALQTAYILEPGDLMLGLLLGVHDYHPVKPCGEKITEYRRVPAVYTMEFLKQKFEADPTILPNTSIGYVWYDTCYKDSTGMAQTLHFIPDSCTSDSSATTSTPLLQPQDSNDFLNMKGNEYVDVVGVVGATFSSTSILINHILNMYEIPQVSQASSSDTLSDISRHEYFFRVYPPDRYQVLAIMSVIKHFQWKYISMIYSEGSYGETAEKYIHEDAKKEGICMAVVRKVPYSATYADFDAYANELIENSKARVVILFCLGDHVPWLFKNLQAKNYTNHFIWLTSEAWGGTFADYRDIEQMSLGTIAITPTVRDVPEFDQWFSSLTLNDFTKYGLMNIFWEKKFNCSINGSSGTRTCDRNTRLGAQHEPHPVTSLLLDAANALIYSIDKLLKRKCPETTGQATRNCITGKEVLESMKTISYPGYTMDTIRFNENGDIRAQYVVQNFHAKHGKYILEHIGSWSEAENRLLLFKKVTWATRTMENKSEEYFVPESVCATSCPPRHYKQQLEVSCCWECRACRENEYLINNNTKCVACPKFTWPQESDDTNCEIIPPSYLDVTGTAGLISIVLTIFGILFTFLVTVLFLWHRNAKLIKASSRELSIIILVGILLSFFVVFPLLLKPKSGHCAIGRFGFILCFTTIYGPLLARTNRIYRIFEAGKKTKMVPSCIAPRSQMMLSGLFILIQAVISTTWAIIEPPKVVLEMPQVVLRYVELRCHMSAGELVTSVSYNLLLIIICCYYAFKTRRLPDNFNESRFICFCVYTTMIMWLAFLPTYFTTATPLYRPIYLSLALIINAYVTTACFFIPKLYAIYFATEDKMNLTKDGPAGKVGKAKAKVTPGVSVTQPGTTGPTNSESVSTSTKTNPQPSTKQKA